MKNTKYIPALAKAMLREESMGTQGGLTIGQGNLQP